MLCTPAPVRALVSNFPVHSRRLHSVAAVRHADPLRILFCGSDDFSIQSLLALDRARRDVPGLIDEIHVAHRPPKPTGRGLKVLREVPISRTAAALSLPTHLLDTFTGFTPPFAYNLVIAVSFGLLVPPRILRLAHYGGLNVHPSLLPDLRGAAPIEHAILQRREHTGVSIQTLHPTTFDAGVVLAQTASPGVKIGEAETSRELEARLAERGARMLVDVLTARRFVAPLEHAGWYAGPADHAPKITKQHHFVDFSSMSMPQILAVQRALGHVWCLLPNAERLVVHEMADTGRTDASMPPGLALDERVGGKLLFRAACGRVGVIKSSTYPGGKAGGGNAKVAKVLQAQTGV